MRLSKALAAYRIAATRWHQVRDDAHKSLKADPASPPWNGRLTQYEMIYAIDEENPQLPDEETEVSRVAEDVLADVRRTLAPYVDALITRDKGNQAAVADVVIDGVTVAENVPAVALIALENDFREIVTLAKEAPEAPRDESWEYDPARRLLRSKIASRLRQAKKRVSKVVVQPTQYQAAVIDAYNEDVPVARQKITKYHGGLLTEDKRELVDAAEKVFLAFQKAREEANAAYETDEVEGIGQRLMELALPPRS
jgi:hypothetical protein